MGVARRLKTIMVAKNITAVETAARVGSQTQTFYNKLQRDAMSFTDAEKIADALGCDIILRDRETGQEF